ncbi:hypothetical protein WAI453_004863 [Rhynchosporium graminicola]
MMSFKSFVGLAFLGLALAAPIDLLARNPQGQLASREPAPEPQVRLSYREAAPEPAPEPQLRLSY